MAVKTEYPILEFKTQEAWREWLEKHYDKVPGVWLRFYKKASGVVSLVYKQALDEALCFGWIDSQAKTYDEDSYLQKFTPRGKKSIWSKVNTDHIARLTNAGKMHKAGLEKVVEAKADGRWDAAYESPKNMEVPEDFLKLLNKNKKAKSFFATLTKANTYAIAWRLHTAKKSETRERRIQSIIAMLEEGKKFH